MKIFSVAKKTIKENMKKSDSSAPTTYRITKLFDVNIEDVFKFDE